MSEAELARAVAREILSSHRKPGRIYYRKLCLDCGNEWVGVADPRLAENFCYQCDLFVDIAWEETLSEV